MIKTIVVQLQANVAGYKAQLGAASASTRQFGREVGDTLTSTDKKTQQSLQRVSRGSLILGGAMLAGFAVAAGAAMRFDKAMSGVSAVSGATAAEMKKLSQAALDAGRDTVFSASEAAQAEAELVKAGISVADVLGGALTGSLDLAAAGQLDLAQAAEISAQAMNIFKLEGSDVSHIADVLAAGANKSAADVGQLGDALRQGGLVARQTGLSLEETVGALSAFADNALIGSDAGTSLKTMLQRLTPQSAEAASLMHELGFSAFDASGNFIGLEGLAGELQSSLRDMTVEQRASALATLFGSDAVRGANVLYEEGERGIRGYVEAVDDQGAAARMAAKQLDNLSGDIEALKGSIETVLIESGSKATGVLRGMTQGATGAVNAFGDLPGPVQSVAAGFLGIGGASLLVLGGLGSLIPRVAEGRRQLESLGRAGQFANRGIGFLGRTSGYVAGAIALVEVATIMHKAFSEMADGSEDIPRVTQALLDLSEGEGSFGDVGDAARGAQDDIADWFDKLGTRGNLPQQKITEALKDIDAAFASMVRDGNIDGARAAIDAFAAGAGLEGSDILPFLDEYDAALVDVDVSNRNAEGSARGNAGAITEQTTGLTGGDGLIAALGIAADAAGNLAEEDKKLLESIKEIVEAEGVFAEATKAATDATPWLEFVNEAKGSLQEYADALAAQNADVLNWQSNLAIVARRAGVDVAAELAQMGEEGIRLTALMANGTDAETLRMADTLRTNARLAGGGMVSELDNAMKIMQLVGSLGAKGTAEAIGAALGIGANEVKLIAALYGISLAEAANAVLRGIGGRTVDLTQTGRHAAPGTAAAAGALFPGDVGMKDKHQAQVARGYRLWGEPETAGESYIPHAGDWRRGRAQDIWLKTGRIIDALPPGVSLEDLRRMRVRDFAVGAVMPGVPDVYPRYGWGVGYPGEESMRYSHDAAQRFADANAFRGLAGSTTGLDPEFLRRFDLYNDALGGILSIVSGFRSFAQQAALYARYLAGTGNLAAVPGTSKHERGLAIDHEPSSTAGMRGTAQGFRLHYPVPGEPWHVEPFARGGIYAASYDRGGFLPPGWSLAGNFTGRPEPVGGSNIERGAIVVKIDARGADRSAVPGIRKAGDDVAGKVLAAFNRGAR